MVNPVLIQAIFKGFEKIGRHSGKLQKAFSAMKEASGVTQVYSTAFEMLSQEASKASMGAIKELVEILQDPDFQPIITTLAGAFRILAAAVKDAWEYLKPVIRIWEIILMLLGKAKSDTEDLVGTVQDESQTFNLPRESPLQPTRYMLR